MTVGTLTIASGSLATLHNPEGNTLATRNLELLKLLSGTIAVPFDNPFPFLIEGGSTFVVAPEFNGVAEFEVRGFAYEIGGNEWGMNHNVRLTNNSTLGATHLRSTDAPVTNQGLLEFDAQSDSGRLQGRGNADLCKLRSSDSAGVALPGHEPPGFSPVSPNVEGLVASRATNASHGR